MKFLPVALLVVCCLFLADAVEDVVEDAVVVAVEIAVEDAVVDAVTDAVTDEIQTSTESSTVEAINSECILPMEPGTCSTLVMIYGYDTEKGACVEIENGGCEGNESNFASMEDCEAKCVKKE